MHTGDVVTVDADGRVTFRARLKDMLKVGGENVSAAEIENHLLTHPAVGVVAVVAAPDARYVEVPAAFVQLASGASVDRRGADRALRRAHRELPGAALRALRRRSGRCPARRSARSALRARIAEELAAAGITEAPRPGSRG